MNDRTRPHPSVALYLGVLIGAVLVAFYARLIVPYLRFGGDLMMWGETDFIGNIIRLRGGYPAYSPVADINSSTYPPIAAILTYSISVVLRLPTEITTFRFIQMGYVVLAALVGVLCWRMVRAQLFPAEERAGAGPSIWPIFVGLTVFLAATSPDTSEWIHALHTDALSLLWSLVTFAVLLRYLDRPGRGRFLMLAAAPVIGFAIKQYLLIWAPVAFFTLLIDDHRNVRRLVMLFLVTTGLTLLAVGVCYVLWGRDYLFWVFEVVGGQRSRIGFSAGGYELSVPRAGDHLLRAWAPLSLGFVGGWLLMRESSYNRRSLALWTPWLVLIGAEAMTSGTGWGALYHFGPGVVVGAIWLLAVLPEVWPEGSGERPRVISSGAALVAIMGVFLALGAVPSGNAGHQRYWARSFPAGGDDYLSAIESEFEGHDPSDVLMDWGNWVYLRTNHLALDRAISMWDFPTVGRYDLLEPMLDRIRGRRYEKILVHRYHLPGFDYDWGNLDRPTGVRAALEQNYDEVRVIPGLVGIQFDPAIMFGGDVSVLVPKQGESPATGRLP